MMISSNTTEPPAAPPNMWACELPVTYKQEKKSIPCRLFRELEII